MQQPAGNTLGLNLDGAAFRKSTLSDNSGPYCVEVAFVGGNVAVRDSKAPWPGGAVLTFTREEWEAFVGGAKIGEFDQ